MVVVCRSSGRSERCLELCARIVGRLYCPVADTVDFDMVGLVVHIEVVRLRIG